MTFTTSLTGSDVGWFEIVSRHPDATIFHHPSWIRVLSECYGYRPFLAALLNKDQQIAVGLPCVEVRSRLTGRRIVALPFTDFCSPLACDDAALSQFIVELEAWHERSNRVEVSIHSPLPVRGPIYKGEQFVTHRTRLQPDAEAVFAQFKKTRVQQPIHQAERAGVRVERGQSWEHVRLFYDFQIVTRSRVGKPVQPLRFFRLLWERVISEDMGFVLLAYKGSQPLAAAVFLHWNKTLTYKYSASDPEYWDLRPNNILLWHAIQWGCEQGYEVFDWGQSDLDNEGLRRFKSGWGSEETEFYYSVLSDHPPSKENGAGRAFTLMSTVLQRSPSWVARVVGELLYAHFA